MKLTELEKLRVLTIVSGYYDVDKNFKVCCCCLVAYSVQVLVVIIGYMKDNWSENEVGWRVLQERMNH